MSKPTLIVELFGAPGSGKSTLAALVYALINTSSASAVAELVQESAKDRIWDGVDMPSEITLFGEQHRRIERLRGKVDIVVTDSPILLAPVFAAHYKTLSGDALPSFWRLAQNAYIEQGPHIAYNIKRGNRRHVQAGRNEDERISDRIAELIDRMLKMYDIESRTITMDDGVATNIAPGMVAEILDRWLRLRIDGR